MTETPAQKRARIKYEREKAARLKAYREEYREKNRERLKAYQREYYLKNREKLLKAHNDWNDAHREEIRAKYKRPRKLIPGDKAEKRREYAREWYKKKKLARKAAQEYLDIMARETELSEAEFQAWREKWREKWHAQIQNEKNAETSGQGDTAPNSINDAGATQSDLPDRSAAAKT